jgi:CBS domain-containing protein
MKSLAVSTFARKLREFDDEPTPVIETIGALVRDPPVTVDRDTPIEQIRRLLVELRVPAIAVVDANDTLCGLVTRTDALRTSDADATAADAMSGFVFSLPAYAPIGKAAALIGYEGVGQVVVVDRDGKLAGIVSAVDLVRYFATERS